VHPNESEINWPVRLRIYKSISLGRLVKQLKRICQLASSAVDKANH